MTWPYAGDAIVLYRIATEAKDYGPDDLSGEGARRTGGRWNGAGVSVIYTSPTRALACLETIVHLTSATRLPMNRFLVEVSVPAAAWAARTQFGDPAALMGWDAEPPGRTSMGWGTRWLTGGGSLLAEVPSVVVPEETNVLINPAHASMAQVTARTVRKWTYDGRLLAAR